jgi:hypothetical protein
MVSQGQEAPKCRIKYAKSVSDYENERKTLTALRYANHPHIITLIGTFSLFDYNYLLFPAAKTDLWQFWMDDTQWKLPVSRHSSLVGWAVEQMCGLADALRTMHNFRLADATEVYGRHGDVKAANVLVYHSLPWTHVGATLKLADMGSSMIFFDEQSRWNIEPGPGTGTYEPPECDLLETQSQAYDMWMLGCMFLEFLVWLLRGPPGLCEFGEQRSETYLFQGALFTSDYFYALQDDYSGQRGLHPQVRHSVQQTIIDIHSMSEDIPPLRDLLSIVEKDLLKIDQRDRISSAVLCAKMENLRAAKD